MRKMYNWMVLLGLLLVVGGVVVFWKTLSRNLPSPFDIVDASGKNNYSLPIIAPANSSRARDIPNATPTAAPTVIADENYTSESPKEGNDIPNSTPVAAPTVITDGNNVPASSIGGIDVLNQTPVAAPAVIADESNAPASSSGGSNALDLSLAAAPTVIADKSYATASTTQPQPVGLIPDRLVIPIINLDAPIIPVSYKMISVDDQVYYQWLTQEQFAVGWHASSALLGLPGNTVLNGHHNAYGMVFKDLLKLGIGDVISVYSGSQEFRYQVVANMLLPERFEPLSTRMANASLIGPSSDERITLITCWPADSNTHRVIIVAFPIRNPDIISVP